MIRELDLGQIVLQWRDDGRWRAVHDELLAAERRGEVVPTEVDWSVVQPGAAYHAGPTYVFGLTVDGIPERVTVGGREVRICVLEGLWGASWRAQRQRVVIYAGGREAAVFDLARRPRYLAPEPDEPVMHDQPAMGWFRSGAPLRADDLGEG